MRGRAVGRATARAAVAGLSLGVFALAGLAVYSTSANAETTRYVRQVGAQSGQWGQLNLNVSIEHEALTDYQRESSLSGRQPLLSGLRSADGNLTWLAEYGDATDVEQAAEVAEVYTDYTQTIRDLIEADILADRDRVDLLAQQASMAASALRKTATNQVTRKQLDMDRYLAEVERKNESLLVASTIIFCVDLVLLAVCAFVLLGYQRRVENEASEHQRRSLHDSLTGLANRSMFAARLDQALLDADRHEEPFGLLVLDLNRFKEVNDTLGHHVGDLLLQEVGQRLSAAVRDSDTVARLGGDEFAVLLPQVASPESCLDLVRRLLDRVQGPAELAGPGVEISASVGAAVYPAHAANAVELFQRADVAMYCAKRNRSGAVMYHVGIEAGQPTQPVRDLSTLEPARVTSDRSR